MSETHVRNAYSESGRIVYDTRILRSVTTALFEPRHWASSEAMVGQADGRGKALFIRPDGLADLAQVADGAGEVAYPQWVLRHYQRGGLVAQLVRDRFLYLGDERTRPVREWMLLSSMWEQGLPVPRPVAARIDRPARSATYRADLITERVPQAVSLSVMLAREHVDESVWRNMGQAIRRFHDAGIFHADLNAHNILVQAGGRVFLIDFDKGSRRRAGRWTRSNLERLLRSLNKIAQQVAAENLSIAGIVIMAVAGQISARVRCIEPRQAIPGHARMHMVHHMQVVVEKEKRQRPAIFDHHGAAAGPVMGAVFQKGADLDDAIADICRHEIGPEWHRRPPDQRQNQHHRRNLQKPGQGDLPLARAHRPDIGAQKTDKPDCRTKQHAPQKRVVDHQQALQPTWLPRPDLRVEVIGFRIVIGVGQVAVLMMGQMQVAKPAIGHQKAEAGKSDHLVDKLVAKRMAMDHFVGQR